MSFYIITFQKICQIKACWLDYSAEIGTLNCNSTNLKKICTRHSTKVLKASLSLRSESTSPKVKRSSLLMPASEATNYSTDQLQVVDITDSTNLDAQQSALLDETKKAKKIPPKGVSMSEVIRLHQVSSNRFLSYLGSLISFLIVSSWGISIPLGERCAIA